MDWACWVLFALAVGPQDEGEIERRVEELSDDDPLIREQAERRLQEIGRSALAALARASRACRDPEARERIDRLLKHPALLPIRPGLAAALNRLGSACELEWIAAIDELLAAGRDAAKEALALWARHGSERGRFRAGQLLSVLEQFPVDGLVYGIVVSEPVSRTPPSGIEIWLNLSSGELILEDNMGEHLVEFVERWSEWMRVGGGAGCGGNPKPTPTFRLAPGKWRVKPRESFFMTWKVGRGGVSSRSVDYGPGRFEIWTEYSSSAGEAGWNGRAKSNRVRIEIE